MKIKVALDWTPNVIHAGMYLAQLQGYFNEAGIEVEFISTDTDNYTKKPVQRLADKEVHVALAPSEHVIDYCLLKAAPIPLKAVAAVMQEETSAFVTLQSSGIDRPAKLDNKTYAGYKTILEETLLASLIKTDGGEGNVKMVTPPRLDIFDAFLREEYDTCWIFMPWEGVIAEMEGFKLHAFHLKDYGIPYGYSPVLITREDFTDEEKKAIQIFLSASAKGYREAADQPEEAAKILVRGVHHDNFKHLDFIVKAMKYISPCLLASQDQWGLMKQERWEAYVQWLLQHHLLHFENGTEVSPGEIKVSSFYTNDWLESVK